MDRVQFERVSKRYLLGDRRTAREALTAAARRAVGRGRLPRRELWSLRDVSFAVADGETLGIVGRNGAGKSTILRVLTGITAPTGGVARTRGRVAALLEVGTGFHQELTGRENVFLNGAILGMSRRDIARNFDRIVEFSGVERFLDTPVKHYSSGMYLRLAFSVAAHLEPDVLVVDEILAVGDAEFQRRCFGRMEEAGREGRAVVLVSHDLEAVGRLCRRALWLQAGRIRAEGPSPRIVQAYLASGQAAARAGDALVRSGPVTVRDVRVRPVGRPDDGVLLRTDPLSIEVDLDVAEPAPEFDVAVYVSTRAGVRVIDEQHSDSGGPLLGPGCYRAELRVPPLLNGGDYVVGLYLGSPYEDLLDEPAIAPFTLHGGAADRPARVLVLDAPVRVTVRR